MKKAAAPEVPKSRVRGQVWNIKRKKTGLYSLDLSLGGGLPLHSVIEIAGKSYNAKSTLTYYMAGCIAGKGEIALLDVETVDTDYPVQAASLAGWTGTLWSVPSLDDEGVPKLHGEMLDDLCVEFSSNKEMFAAMVDSIGNLRSEAETNSESEAANMGRRARMVKQFLGKMETHLRAKPSILFCVNHLHPNLGSPGQVTSGGEAMQYKPAIKMRLYVDKREDKYWVVKGNLTKRKYVPSQYQYPPEFEFVTVPGFGVHRGLTAANDAKNLGLVDKKVQLGGLVSKAPNDEAFYPYFDVLRKKYG